MSFRFKQNKVSCAIERGSWLEWASIKFWFHARSLISDQQDREIHNSLNGMLNRFGSIQFSPERHSLLHRSLGGEALLVELEAGRGRGVGHPSSSSDAFEEKARKVSDKSKAAKQKFHGETILCRPE